MENNTLLDFLTQRASETVTAEFQRVLSKETPQDLDKIFKTLFKSDNPAWFYQFDDSDKLKDVVPDNEEKSLRQKMTDALKNMGKGVWEYYRGKDPLDMSSRDIENLFQVYRDQGTKNIEIRTQILPDHLEGKENPAQIESMISKFYTENKEFFESASNISYNRETKVLTFDGSEYILQKLMDSLKMKPDVQKAIMGQRKETSGTWYLPFQPPPEGSESNAIWLDDWKNEVGDGKDVKADYQEFKRAFDAHYSKLVRKGDLEFKKVKWSEYGGREYLVFDGSLTELEKILNSFFQAPRNTAETIQAIKQNYSVFKKAPGA